MTMVDIRAEQWRHHVADAFGQLVPERLGGAALGRVSKSGLGLVQSFTVSGTPQILHRTSTSLQKAPEDPLKICIQRAGRTTLRQGENSVTLHAGQAALYDTGRPYALRLEGAWDCMVMTLPREALGVSQRTLSVAMSHPFSAVVGPGAVLQHLLESAASANAGSRIHLGDASVSLLAGLVSSDDVRPLEADPQAVRAAVLGYIATHLRDPDLDVAQVARAHAMSTRSLHRLFEGTEHGIAELIRGMRLDHIHRDLADPAQSRRGIMVIASQWGYTDQAHLTRAFRARFGDTPAAFRRQPLVQK